MNIFTAIFNPREFTGWHMLGVLFLFFGTIISVNLVLAFDASTTWTGLIVKNSYVESQDFNNKIALHDKQLELGWSADISYVNGRLVVTLLGEEEKPVLDAIISAEVGRPVHEGEDQLVNFIFEDGNYIANAKLDDGLWSAQIQVIGPSGEMWLKTIRFIVPTSTAS